MLSKSVSVGSLLQLNDNVFRNSSLSHDVTWSLTHEIWQSSLSVNLWNWTDFMTRILFEVEKKLEYRLVADSINSCIYFIMKKKDCRESWVASEGRRRCMYARSDLTAFSPLLKVINTIWVQDSNKLVNPSYLLRNFEGFCNPVVLSRCAFPQIFVNSIDCFL